MALVSHFTPSLMAPEALEAILVQRHALLDDLVERVDASAAGDAKTHTLLVGQRGMGKTHLITMLYHRVRQQPGLDRHLRIAWLKEDEWGVDSYLALLLAILAALDHEYPGLIDAQRRADLFEHGAADAEGLAERLLLDALGECTLLLLAENLDQLFDGFGEPGQQRLRALVQNSRRVCIVASTPALFAGVSNHKLPFYGFFRTQHLRGLSVDEAGELLSRIAQLHGDTALVAALASPAGRARLRALHHLAGGNARLYVVFSQFVTADNIDTLALPFMRTLDELTPYYQARMQALSLQQRKIVEYLADARGARPVKDIAKATFISSQTVSAQLKRLSEAGFVRSEKSGRESFYEIEDVLLRFCLDVTKRCSGRIGQVVELLTAWFAQPTESQALLEALLAASGVDSRVAGDHGALLLLPQEIRSLFPHGGT
ncbi:MarR family transcriptional regulator [Jeongeupia sp. USM3]|uniref:MarR family transcriptional regulator n=1 Tax=Jeongeupia sp. USM3 TaxID=1906741 RepID=UPI00089DE74E|nr:MarR family transcriptional regulator [Jeongeupia sp. USM3]AOY01946.1 hypothetical protein BJP62_16775 [Jeongeupia sp. USM3]